MPEYKYKKSLLASIGENLAGAFDTIYSSVTTTVENAKDAWDSPQMRRTRVIASFAKMGLLGDPTEITTIVKTMFPLNNGGINIDYGRKFHEGCPVHNTPTFGTSDPYKVWCPLCMDFLELNTPFY